MGARESNEGIKESAMNIDRCIGWALVFAAVLLLVSAGKLDLLLILLPLSLLLAYGIRCSWRDKNRLTGGLKKG